MAFADALVTELDADVVMVDRRHRPGGHWNDAHPFVRLDQPSAFYGVNPPARAVRMGVAACSPVSVGGRLIA